MTDDAEARDEELGAAAAGRLAALRRDLDGAGFDASVLVELELEIEVLERPPGLLARVAGRARVSAGRHWANFVGELQESREVMALVAARLRGERLSPEERDCIRAQLLDLVKVFPAGLIAAANSAFPVPGTGLFTPWILARLDLMPSRWREAHLLAKLAEERARLLAHGLTREARRLQEIGDAVAAEAARREAVGADAGLLTHWDRNRNGVWDPEEIDAYLQALDRLRALARRARTRKRWFILDRGEIFGALRLSELVEDPELADHLADDGLLVCYDGKTGWVALPDLLGREPRFG